MALMPLTSLKPLRQPRKVVRAMSHQISTMVVPSSKIVVSLLLKNFNYLSINPFVNATYTLHIRYIYATPMLRLRYVVC